MFFVFIYLFEFSQRLTPLLYPTENYSYPLAALAPAQHNNDPPSEALVEISKIKECRNGRPPLSTPQRLCGRVCNVVIWEQPHWDTVANQNNVRIGDFIRLRNVQESFFPEIGIRCKSF